MFLRILLALEKYTKNKRLQLQLVGGHEFLCLSFWLPGLSISCVCVCNWLHRVLVAAHTQS